MTIIESRLEGVPGKLVDPDAVQFASRKVAAVSGDARRALDICRRAVEIAEAESLDERVGSETPSKRPRDTETSGTRSRRRGRVTIRVIKQAIDEATSTPTLQLLRTLPLSSKLFLAALIARNRRSGLTDCSLCDIIEEVARLSQIADYPGIQENLLKDKCTTDGLGQAGKQSWEQALPRTHSLGTAAIELMEAGVVDLDLRSGERTGRVHLKINREEIILALRDDSDVRGLGLVHY